MTTAALLLGLVLNAQTVDKPTLQYYQQTFVIRQQDDVLRIPLQESKIKSPLFVAFRKNDTFAVWDDRGLTIRRRSKTTSTRLPDIVVSPRVFTRDEILKTLDQIQDGQRTKEASGISGAKRIGNIVYFLVRWDEKSGKPWAEALVGVDISSRRAEAALVGRFDSLSTGTKPIDEKLQIVDGKLAIVSHGKNTWGLSTYDPSAKQFDFHPMGSTLVSFETLNPTQGLFIETSSYGTTIAGRMDLVSGTRKILYEGHERVRFLDTADPIIVLATANGKTKIVNCESGAVRTLPFDLEGRRAADNILVWTPTTAPKAVWLLSPTSWEAEARWRAN